MYEVEAIFTLALLFIIVYFVGSRQNKKLSIKYAKAIKSTWHHIANSWAFVRMDAVAFGHYVD